MPEQEVPGDEPDLEVRVPKTGQTTEWLGQVETSHVLDKTDLYQENFIGTPIKDHMNRVIKPTHPGEHQKCEPMTYPENGQPWWHPAFVFKMPVHAVRIRLTELGAIKKKRWDVIFAGEPGGLTKIINAAVPVGGKMPVFDSFCPPLDGKLKMELRLTEADNKPPLFDEKLTILPAAAASKERLKFVLNDKGRPRLPSHTKMWLDGAVRHKNPISDEDAIEQSAKKDILGRVNYFSMPPLIVAASLAGFL